MAIIKSFELDNGVVGDYWICSDFDIKPETSEIVATFEPYVSKAKFTNGKKCADKMKVIRLTFKVKGQDWADINGFNFTRANLKEMIYTKALSFPQFAGGTLD